MIRFLERFDGVSFLDALRLLAQATGEELPANLFRKRAKAENPREEESFEVLRRAEDLYRRTLSTDEGAAAREYLLGRGLSGESLERFGVGWAPREGSPLLAAATRAGIAVDRLVETGLVRRAEDGRVYDFFRGRLTIPIRDRLGRTVGFGARILPRDETAADGRHQPKYVNTAETALFHKGRLIYGLDLAVVSVRRTKHLILVEGYTDVMAANQVGLENVAAVLGTSTTEDHAALVRRSGAQRVTLVFDGDEAGRRASERALAGLLPLGLDLDVAMLPQDVDPCDLLLGPDGRARFQALIGGADDWFRWTLRELEPLAGAALARRVDQVFELLARLEKPVERSARLAELARDIGLPDGDVRLQWREFETRRRGVRAPSRGEPEPEQASVSPTVDDPAVERAFEYLLGALLLDNSLIPVYAELESRCPAGDLRRLFRLVLSLYDDAEDDQPIHTGRLLTVLGDDPLRDRAALLEDLASTAESPQALARDQELWLQRRDHERELRVLRGELTEANESSGGTKASKNEVLKNLHEELRRRRVPGAAGTGSSVHPH